MAATAVSNAAEQKTYVMVKPDGVQRGLVGRIIQVRECCRFPLIYEQKQFET